MDSRTRVQRPLRVRCPFTPSMGPTVQPGSLQSLRHVEWDAGRRPRRTLRSEGSLSVSAAFRREGPAQHASVATDQEPGWTETPLRFRWGCTLASIQLGVEALLRKQAFVSALLHDAALIHHQYQFRIAYGAQAVGDDETGALSH